MRAMYRDLAMGASVQLLAFCFAASVLDLGRFASATIDLSIAYWFGVLLILLRRSKSLSAVDHLFIRFRLIPILAIGVPVLLRVWIAKRVM